MIHTRARRDAMQSAMREILTPEQIEQMENLRGERSERVREGRKGVGRSGEGHGRMSHPDHNRRGGDHSGQHGEGNQAR